MTNRSDFHRAMENISTAQRHRVPENMQAFPGKTCSAAGTNTVSHFLSPPRAVATEETDEDHDHCDVGGYRDPGRSRKREGFRHLHDQRTRQSRLRATGAPRL